MSTLQPFLLVAALAYLLGSIPFGLVLTRLAGLGDIRSIGSGNIGATNVLRTGHTALAALTLLLDAGKGAVAVLIARGFGAEMAALAGIAVVVGHMAPLWLRFAGGKGVATAGGVLLAYAWPVGLAGGVTWLAVVAGTRYSSLGAVLAAALAPFYAWALTQALLPTATVLVIALLVLARHRDNIGRLIRGEEHRVSLRKAK